MKILNYNAIIEIILKNLILKFNLDLHYIEWWDP